MEIGRHVFKQRSYMVAFLLQIAVFVGLLALLLRGALFLSLLLGYIAVTFYLLGVLGHRIEREFVSRHFGASGV